VHATVILADKNLHLQAVLVGLVNFKLVKLKIVNFKSDIISERISNCENNYPAAIVKYSFN